MHERSLVSVKVEPRSTFLSCLYFSYLIEIYVR